MPKFMSYHKPIMVITGRAHCFPDCMYITLILLLRDLSILCVVDHLWPFILCSLHSLLSLLTLLNLNTYMHRIYKYIYTQNIYIYPRIPELLFFSKFHSLHTCSTSIYGEIMVRFLISARFWGVALIRGRCLLKY